MTSYNHYSFPGDCHNEFSSSDHHSSSTYSDCQTNSFALRLAYKINDVSFPENVELRTETQARIQDSVNKLMNGLLIQPDASPFTFPQANFTHLPNEIRANVEYVYQEGDINQPSNFLAAILAVSGPTSSTVSPVIATTNSPAVTTTASPRTVVGPVFIFVRLVFHTNNTVPSESDVLAKGSPFLNGDEIRLNDTVRVQNLTYERLSDNSFALRLAYKINDVSFPENVELRTETQARIQDSVNKLMNGLLIKPNASPFTFPQANFTHLPNEIRANVEYVYQEGDINQPSNFLAAILAVSGPTSSTVSPVIATTNSPAVTTTASPRTVVGPVFIFVRLVFHTNNTVPSESDVLAKGSPFLNGDEIRLNDTVRVQNLTYERLSDNSFALRLAYKINDVSFPENVELRTETQARIQDSVNKLMNGLLIQPNASPFTFPQANFTHLPNEIRANVEYVYQEGDINQPSNFLAAILAVSGPTTTTASPVIATTNSPAVTTTAAPRTVVGPVFIFVRLVFHTNNTVPSESDVLAKGSPFLNGDEIRLNDTVRVQNLTYERLTDHSFALSLAYKINDVSFPENVELRTKTQGRIQDAVNKLMNGLLIQPDASPFTFPQAKFTHLPNEIHANVEYLYQKGDINQPSNFLAAILAVSGPTTTTASPVIATTNSPAVTTTAAPRTVVGPVFIFVRLVFHTNNTVPSESDVLAKGSPFLNGDEIRLNDTVRVQNLTYERLTDHSFALSLAYKINDVSFPENVELRTKTQGRIQDAVNKLMNGLLIQPDASPFTFPQAKFTHLPNEIHANVEYLYQKGDINQPSNFLAAILAVSGPTTTTASPVIATTNSPAVTTTAAPRTVVGPVFIFVRLVFHTNNTVPSESDVLAKGSPFLNGDEIRLNDTVRVQNLTYERLTDHSFALSLAYKINDVSFPENVELRTKTQGRIQDAVNKLMNGLLIQPDASPFTFPQAKFTHLPNEIHANVEYLYQKGDINQPSNFLAAILAVSGPTTTTASPVIATTNSPAVTTTAAPRTVVGPVFIFVRLVFHTNNTVPSESDVLANGSPFLNGDEIRLNDTVRVQNLTYERLTDHSFALSLAYKINDVSFPENVELRTKTQGRIQDAVNKLMNGLLIQPDASPFTFPQAKFT
ncbi:uncharacterized protein LOC118227467 [Anguilla anguilla]|uniref:uncharacterized protein LOC118227467 n=1 Tax=Anguilla anguilla TaxID=7936 RepID=UPI0015B1A981|nr:uncharacterized protein LOC118227467 [Anguilla anguilla]